MGGDAGVAMRVQSGPPSVSLLGDARMCWPVCAYGGPLFVWVCMGMVRSEQGPVCFCGCVDLCLCRDSGVLAHVPIAKLGQTPPCLGSVGSWVQYLRVCVHTCVCGRVKFWGVGCCLGVTHGCWCVCEVVVCSPSLQGASHPCWPLRAGASVSPVARGRGSPQTWSWS